MRKTVEIEGNILVRGRTRGIPRFFKGVDECQCSGTLLERYGGGGDRLGGRVGSLCADIWELAVNVVKSSWSFLLVMRQRVYACGSVTFY